jgi:hypothetical protein
LSLSAPAHASCQDVYRKAARFERSDWKIPSWLIGVPAMGMIGARAATRRMLLPSLWLSVGITAYFFFKGHYRASKYDEVALALDQAENEDPKGKAFDGLFKRAEGRVKKKGVHLDRKLFAQALTRVARSGAICDVRTDEITFFTGRNGIVDKAIKEMRYERVPQISENDLRALSSLIETDVAGQAPAVATEFDCDSDPCTFKQVDPDQPIDPDDQVVVMKNE